MPVGVRDVLVPARKGDRLEGDEADLVAVLQRELDDRAYLIVVDRVHDGHDEADVDARGMQRLDRAQLHVEQIADFSMRVGELGHAVELQVGDPHAGRAGFVREGRILGEADAVGGRLDAEVADLSRIPHGVEKDRRDCRLAPRELHRHLPLRLDAHRVVEQFPDVVQTELVNVAHLVRVHEARVAHHVAAIGQVDRQDRAAPVLDRGRSVVVQAVGDRVEIPAREQAFEPLEECRVDRQRVDEGAVLGAGLFDQDLSVALDDVRLDFGDVVVDE